MGGQGGGAECPPNGLQGKKRKRGKKRKERKGKKKEKGKGKKKGKKEKKGKKGKGKKKGRRREKEEKEKRKGKEKKWEIKTKKTMAVRTRGGGAVDPRYFENVQFFSWKCNVGLYQILQFYFWKCKSTLMNSSVARTPVTPFAFEILRKLLTHFSPFPTRKISRIRPWKIQTNENRKI